MVESDSVIQTLRDIQARGCISRDDLPNNRFRYLLELGYLSGFSSSSLIPGGNHSLYFSVSEKGKQAIHASDGPLHFYTVFPRIRSWRLLSVSS